MNTIDTMVSRFLAWRLPDDFRPDAGIAFTPPAQPHTWPVGTNLFTAEQVRTMLVYVTGAVEQHQAKPVAWRFQTHAGGAWYLVTFETAARAFECNGEGGMVQPLYTHADPGEVERLREELKELRDSMVFRTSLIGRTIEERDTLRAQLAERDALRPKLKDLLTRLLDNPHTFRRHICNSEEICELINAISTGVGVSVPTYQRASLNMGDAVRDRLTLIAREAAISSTHRYSYMPTTPEDALRWHPHIWVLEAMRMVERSASAEQSAECETCDGHGAVGNILNAEPCPDCSYNAPTGRKP